MNQPDDYRARQRALDPTASFAVSAPAGSGKTGLLTQRVLNLLPLCSDPEEIICITFTRKAAAEMRQRINQAITAAAEQPRPENSHDGLTWDLARRVLQRDHELNWNLRQAPQRLRVHTIDGLCRSLTLMNPMSSAIGGSTRMLDNPRRAYYQAADLALQSLEGGTAIGNDLATLLLHFDNDRNRTIDLLVRLLANRDQWLEPLLASRATGAREYFEAVLQELIEESLEQLSAILLPYAGDLCLMADYAGHNCQVGAPQSSLCRLSGIEELPAAEAAALDAWRSISDLLLTSGDDGNWRKATGLNVRFGFPPGTDKATKMLAKARKLAMAQLLQTLAGEAGVLDLLRLVRRLPPPAYTQQQWRLLDALTRVLPHVVSQLKLVFRKLNAADYSEITQGALLALGDEDNPTELGLALDYQIRHILVDEFQDTSTSQWRLLEKLTAGWQQGDGRSLFIVGDGMQSCYGFRNANVGLFLDARQSGIGDVALEPLDLTVNFRSQAGVVDWVNRAFAVAFPERQDISRGAVPYSPSVASRSLLEDAAVKSHVLVDAGDAQPEADKVTQLVQQALAGDPNDNIAILVRDRGRLRAILPALQRAGITWKATDIDPLASRMAVQDLLSLTRALCDCSDRNAWLAILRAPWIGLDNADLLTIAGPQPEDQGCTPADGLSIVERLWQFQQIEGLNGDGRAILQRAVPLLQLAWSARRRKSLRQSIEGLWVALGGPATLLDSSELDNAAAFFALLEQHDEGGSIGNQEDFLSAVKLLYAGARQGSDARVQVMTIHKSKGLEFDVVIMPGLEHGMRTDEQQLLLWQERINTQHDKRLLLSPLSATGDDTDPLYHYLRLESRLKSELEATRLFYVGCTRAIKRLYLLGSVNSDSKSELPKPPPTGSLLAAVWSTISTTAEFHRPGAEPETKTRGQQFCEVIRRLPATWQAPSLVPASLLAAYRGRELDSGDNQVSDDEFRQRHSRYIGSVLHRTLAQVVREGIARWDAARIGRQQPYWKAQLRQLGLVGLVLEQAAQQVELGLRRCLDHDVGRWILDPGHSQSDVEVSYWSDADGVSNSILDRTFVVSGERWIIDYKSSQPAAEQTIEEFVRQEAVRYGPQMQRYRDLFRREKVRTALYFPFFGHFHEFVPN